jgi:hypothetical protein
MSYKDLQFVAENLNSCKQDDYTSTTVAVFLVVAHWTNHKSGLCWLSHRNIGQLACCSPRAVRYALGKLQRDGWLVPAGYSQLGTAQFRLNRKKIEEAKVAGEQLLPGEATIAGGQANIAREERQLLPTKTQANIAGGSGKDCQQYLGIPKEIGISHPEELIHALDHSESGAEKPGFSSGSRAICNVCSTKLNEFGECPACDQDGLE